MSPITVEEAARFVDPNLSDEPPAPGQDSPKLASAKRIAEGVAANDIYWGHRSELEALRARFEGHGVLQRGGDEPDAPPAVEGTATDAPLGAGATTSTGTALVPSPDNANETIAKLRQQIRDAGGEPGA